MSLPPLSNRLMSAVPYVREGAFVADIGTDHAYLPIYLCRIGKIRGAVAADIGKGPLAIAAANIRENGLADKIPTCLSDGLEHIGPYAPTDIIVFGMGGELIVSILHAAPWVKDASIRLILQPMTKSEILRAYLLENGFDIIDECLTEDQGRIYQTLCAEYDGKARTDTPLALFAGRQNLKRGGALLCRLLDTKKKTLTEIYNAKTSAGLRADEEHTLLEEIQNYQKEMPL